MLISELAENLRRLVRQRIDAGQLSGSELARLTGIRQAHISNFLNRRRGLSVESFDTMLKGLQLSAEDLLGRKTAPAAQNLREYDDVPLVAHEVAHRPTIPAMAVMDVLKFKRSYLKRLRPLMHGKREEWTRFIILRANADAEVAMSPRVTSGTTMLIDRHYNDLEPYRRKTPNLYAVWRRGRVLIRYVELREGQMLLRPANREAELDFVALGSEKELWEHIVGRVCYVGMEV